MNITTKDWLAEDCWQVFVYGTLMPGYENHPLYCRDLLAAEPARLPGRLYLFPEGYPGLVIPDRMIVSEATGDIATDVATQAALWRLWTGPASEGNTSPRVIRPRGDWSWIEGKLLTLPDPERTIPALDELEDCDGAGDYQEYCRVLAPVALEDGAVAPAWLYTCDPVALGLARLPGDRWPPGDPVPAD